MKTCTKCGGEGPFAQEMKRGKLILVVCANCHRQRTHDRAEGKIVPSSEQTILLPEWATKDWHELVGKMDDLSVAALAGIPRQDVYQYRKDANIPSYNTTRAVVWQHIAGTMSDRKVARFGRVTKGAVADYRKRRGIPVFVGKHTRKEAA